MTEQKKSNREKVVESDAIFDSIGDGAIATNADGKINRINEIALNLLGKKRDEVMGKWYPGVINVENEKGEKISPIELPITKSLISGEPVTERVIYIKKDNTKLPVSVTVSPIVLDQSPIGAIEVFRDITEEVELERTKSEFISVATHQLKSPPGALKWSLELLLNETVGKLNKEQKDILTSAKEVTKKMVETVNALLNVSRLELGTFIVNPVPVDYKEISKLILKEQEQKIKNKKLKIVEKYDKIPEIPADPGLAKVILENVMSNAIKYTPDKGSVTITIENKPKAKKIVISVKDTGYGIPKKQQDKIFGKMFRADNVIGKEEGTGLGLYLLKSIVENANGKVWFESTEGKGTTFFIELPYRGMTEKKGTSNVS